MHSSIGFRWLDFLNNVEKVDHNTNIQMKLEKEKKEKAEEKEEKKEIVSEVLSRIPIRSDCHACDELIKFIPRHSKLFLRVS